jgi:hypothetical protein
LHWHTSSLLLKTMNGGGGTLFSSKSCFQWILTWACWCS